MKRPKNTGSRTRQSLVSPRDQGVSMNALKIRKPVGGGGWLVSLGAFAAASLLLCGTASATTIVPISDKELRSRADVVVRGIVVSTDMAEDTAGRPETVSVIRP